ncbi:MAG: membrane dipeptidase [Spirochaetota bacterium]
MKKAPFVFDIHGHAPGLLPTEGPLRSAVAPQDTGIERLKSYGVDACVLSAVGDPATFGVGTKNDYGMVEYQLDRLHSLVKAADGTIVGSQADILQGDFRVLASKERIPIQVVLGVEGLDFLDGSLEIIDKLYESGVRLIGPVHYTANAIGGICMDLRGDPNGAGTKGGLTAFGKSVVDAANSLRMILDMTHANDATILDAIECSNQPIVCSHTGPRALCDTPRYLPDPVLKAIAGSGGLIGLWPERMGNSGPANLDEFTRMISYVVDLCGIGSLAIGTDFNGVPGYCNGYRGPIDIGKIEVALAAAGLPPAYRSAIMGGNAQRFVATGLKA